MIRTACKRHIPEDVTLENIVQLLHLAQGSEKSDAEWILQKFREEGYVGLLLQLENLDFLGPCPRLRLWWIFFKGFMASEAAVSGFFMRLLTAFKTIPGKPLTLEHSA